MNCISVWVVPRAPVVKALYLSVRETGSFINLFHLPSWNTRHRQSIGSSACPVVRVLLMQVHAAILLRPFYLQAVAA